MLVLYHLCLYITFNLFYFSLSAIVKTGTITKIPHIPYDYSYSVFSSKYKLQFILLCEKTMKKVCNEKQDLLNHFQKIYDSSHVGVAVIETKNSKEILRERLINEGFPSIYFISFYTNERELLTFNVNQDSLSRFIKCKLDPFKKPIANEQALIQSLNANSATRAIVVIGNNIISDEDLFYSAKIGEMRLIYQINNEDYAVKVNKGKEGLVVYFKHKTTNEYNNRAIEVDKGIEKNILSNRLLFVFKEGINTDFNQLSSYDLDLVFEKNILSIIYIYNTISDIDYIKENIKSFIQKQQDKISFSKASINDDLLIQLDIKKIIELNNTILPGFLCLIPSGNHIVYDDVFKYFIPFNQGKNINERLNEGIANNNHHNRILFADNRDNLLSIKSHIANKEEFLLLICSHKILKYRRITQRIKRTFAQIKKHIIYEEIDPLTNEIDFMTYEYVPTIAYIKLSKTSSDIIISKLENDFSSEAILNFIKTYSNIIIDPSSIIHTDNHHPLYPVHKSRYEKKILSKGAVNGHVGLKRLWWSLKTQGKIIKRKNDQKYLFDYLGYSDEDYEKKDYANNSKKKNNSIKPKTEL